MQKQNELKIYKPLGSLDAAGTIAQQTAVRVLRQLENELRLVNQVENLTIQLNLLLRGKALEKLTPSEFAELETVADQIERESEKIRAGRQLISTCLDQFWGQDDSTLSVRQFIQLTAEPLRKQLNDVRTRILKKSHGIRAKLSSSQAVIFYSVNAYRQLLEGLMDVSGSGGQYRADGPPVAFPPGKLLRKTC